MTDQREKWTGIRIRFIAVVFIVIYCVFAARAFYLQIIKGGEWSKMAARQHQRIVPLTPGRGEILDCTGQSLAISVEMDSCFAEPHRIKDAKNSAAKLAPLLKISREDLEARLSSGKHFVWLERHVVPQVAARIRALQLEGVGFVKESKRYYPNMELASHILGFTGIDPNGLEGIERKYDSTILGSSGYFVTERDALGREVAVQAVVVKHASKGHSLALTIDQNIQYIVEQELKKGVISSGAKGGIAIVMEPSTGKILALANYPSFNPNTPGQYSADVLRNHAVTDSFEPGSTMKVFLIAAALEEKVVKPRERFNCENGSYSIGGKVIHDTHPYSSLMVPDILKFSSNIGAAKIGFRLGRDRLHSYLQSFGFGQKSGIDLPGEAPGYLRRKSQWFSVDLATISFGQGITATPIQLTSAMSAIANGGVLMKPYVVAQVLDVDNTVLERSVPQVLHRVVSPETARAVTNMMEGVTGDGGTGINAALEGYKVAGKTGTAQKVDQLTKSYSVDKRTASFVGFVPADNPKIVVTIIIDEPKTSSYGGVVAAPVFGAIANKSLAYLKVPSSDATVAKARPAMEAAAPTVTADVAVADGTITSGDEGLMMPNFMGMSMRMVMRSMENRGLNVKLIGSGRAVEQNPQPGQLIRSSDQVWVKFAAAI